VSKRRRLDARQEYAGRFSKLPQRQSPRANAIWTADVSFGGWGNRRCFQTQTCAPHGGSRLVYNLVLCPPPVLETDIIMLKVQVQLDSFRLNYPERFGQEFLPGLITVQNDDCFCHESPPAVKGYLKALLYGVAMTG
jgi:hypothetical protein